MRIPKYKIKYDFTIIKVLVLVLSIPDHSDDF